MSMIRSVVAIVVFLSAGTVSVTVEPVWTEAFTDGVGRFNITTGHAEKVFVHNPADENINATFIRRDSNAEPDYDRRLALLGGTATHDNVAAFRLVWTPLSASANSAWPSIGFFDSSTNQFVTGIKVRRAGEGGQNWALRVEGVGDIGLPDYPPWQFNKTYLLEFEIDGPAGTIHFSTAVLVEGDFVPEDSRSVSFPDTAEYEFDLIGFSNIIDDQGIGLFFVADVDDFSLLGLDCNGNEVLDFLDIANEESNDNNSNGIPDECECFADINGDGVVDAWDLALLLGAWGPCPEPPADCPADIHGDGDGIVRADDLATLLGAWGPCL